MNKNMNLLQDKVALVTGASKGIGAGIAKALARAGASVVVNYASSKSGADKVVDAIAKAGGKAITEKGDVAQTAEAKKLIDTTLKQYGRLDIVVNNSGVFEMKLIEEITDEHFHRQFNINVLGLLHVTQAAVPHLQEGASVINVSSVVSRLTPPGSAVYTGTKGAIDAITGVLARELAPRGIRVNAVNPGLVETEGTHSAGMIGTDWEKGLVAQTPLGRTGQPADIADVVVFLASDASRWMTGETLTVSGGLR
jgi:3-oxoacyl-[acyl-carrier protein] reductase